MKQISLLLFCAVFGYNSLLGQNTNWTLPGQYLNHSIPQLQNLPQPSGSDTYDGDPAEYIHAGYTGPDGELQFFTVDEYAYDKNGRLIGEFLDDAFDFKAGFNERLILPMGDDCKRFAIIYRSSLDGSYTSQLKPQALYMSVYDTEAINTWGNPNAIGALELYNGNGQSLIDISKRDGLLYHQNGLGLYGYNDNTNPSRTWNNNMHIAASDLIDGCYYRVYVFDGKNLIKYHLTDTDLEWQGIIETGIPNASTTLSMRSEMELIKRSNGDYRIAIPTIGDQQGVSGIGVTIYDISGSTGNTISSSRIYLDYEDTPTDADPYGLEFDASGQYLYISHAVTTGFPNIIDVYDVDNATYVSLPLISNSSLTDFNLSFIERYGNDLYLASETHLGRLLNASNPSSATFNSTYQSLSGTYISSIPGVNNDFDRQILPDQIDMAYPDPVEDMSCACCREYSGDAQKYATTQNESWDQNGNSITGSGTDIYISQELRVRKGTTLELSNLNFYFGKDAKVVVERGDGTLPGGQLVMNNTVFTLDDQCIPETYDPCDTPGECDYLFWEGVRVEGVASEDQPTSGFTNQGKMIMKNNSMIEYAQVGIVTNNENCNNCGGGILTIENSTFKDNVTGIFFTEYVRYAGGNETFNRSIVRANNFTRTGDIPFNSKLTHVRVKNSSTINLRGNIYQNEAWQNYDIDFRGYGVHATNSSVSEKWLCATAQIPCPNKIRSEYKNLRRGIDASTWSSTRTVSVGHAIFENNEIGVAGGGLIRPEILDSDFYVINSHNATGIYLLGSTAYSIENNYFTAMSTSPVVWMFGIVVHDSGPDPNEIYNNRFEDITTGIASAGVNASCTPSFYDIGLKWVCNRFDATIPNADIYVDGGNVSDEQGGCTSGDKPARNIFSHTGLPAMDIEVKTSTLQLCTFNNNPVSFEIKYYHNQIPFPPSLLDTRLVPVEYTANYVFPNQCTVLPQSDDCPVRNTSLDGIGRTDKESGGGAKSSESEAIYESVDDYQAALAQLYSSSSESVSESSEMINESAEIWKSLIGQFQWDTSGVYPADEVMALLEQYPPIGSTGKFASALSAELEVSEPEWITEQSSFLFEADMISVSPDENGDLPYDLTAFKDEYDFSNTALVASLNELYAEHDQSYILHLEMPADHELPASFGTDDEGKSNDLTESPSAILIMPNPFDENFTLSLSTSMKYTTARVVFHDLLGRRIAQSVHGNISRLEVDASAFPSGVLIYSVYLDGELFDTGRIVKAE